MSLENGAGAIAGANRALWAADFNLQVFCSGFGH